MRLSNEQVLEAITDFVLSLDLEGEALVSQIWDRLGLNNRADKLYAQKRGGLITKEGGIRYLGLPEDFKGFYFSKSPHSMEEGWFGYVGVDITNSGYMRVYKSNRDEDWVFTTPYGLGSTRKSSQASSWQEWPLKWDLPWFDINSLFSHHSPFINWLHENPLEVKQ